MGLREALEISQPLIQKLNSQFLEDGDPDQIATNLTWKELVSIATLAILLEMHLKTASGETEFTPSGLTNAIENELLSGN